MKSRVIPVTITAVTIGWFAGIFLVSQKAPIQADRLVGRASSATPTPSPDDSVTVVSPTPSPTEAPAVAGQKTVHLSLFNIQINVTDPITDLVYGPVKTGSTTSVGFTTEALLAKFPSCKAGALGLLVRYPDAQAPKWMATSRIKSAGGYTYFYQKPAFTCATGKDGTNTVAEAVATLKNSALPGLH
jgi:hypothetical protein